MPYSERYGFIEDIGEKTDNRCHICHEEAHPDDYGSPAGPLGRHATTVDHLVPQSEGGTHDPDNLLLAHAACNSSRGTRPVEEARLEWAGTTEKPLSTTEEWELADHLAELQAIALRERRLRNWGTAGLVALGAAALGALAWWWLSQRDGAKERKDKTPELGEGRGATVGETLSKEASTYQNSPKNHSVSAMNLDRSLFEQALLQYFKDRGVLRSGQERLLAELDHAELVTVQSEGRRAYEVWIPGWTAVVAEDVCAELTFEDVTLHVSEPDPNGQSQTDWRMDVVDRRPLFV